MMKMSIDQAAIDLIDREVSLCQWLDLSSEERAVRLPSILERMKELCGVTAALSFEMPAGFEMANGLFDHIKNVLYLNLDAPGVGPMEQLFYLIHEFRHSVQFSRADLFPAFLTESMRYIIQYDGTCYRTEDGQMQETKLEGEQAAYYNELYLCQPYERDASEFAHRCLSAAAERQGVVLKGLDELYAMWSPKWEQFPESEAEEHLRRAYEQIDQTFGV